MGGGGGGINYVFVEGEEGEMEMKRGGERRGGGEK